MGGAHRQKRESKAHVKGERGKGWRERYIERVLHFFPNKDSAGGRGACLFFLV